MIFLFEGGGGRFDLLNFATFVLLFLYPCGRLKGGVETRNEKLMDA